MRRSRYQTREESRETIIRGRYRENHVPKPPRGTPRKKIPQYKPPQNQPFRRSVVQQQRDERSTSSTEKSSLYNYNTDHSSHTQQTDIRTNLSKPTLFHIAESAGATLAAAAISPFDEEGRGLREHSTSSFFEGDDDDLRESPSDELPLTVVEKAIDQVVDATCGDVIGTQGTQAASLLTKSYLKTEEIIIDVDRILDPTIPNPFEGLRSEKRPIYEAASFPKVTFREVKLDPKKTVASTAMQYPEPRRPMIKPRIPKTTSTKPTKTKSPMRSMVNRLKSVQNKIVRRRNRPVQESRTKKAELLEGRRASNSDRYSRLRAHSDASEKSASRAKHRRRPLDSQESREDATSSLTLALHECPSAREYPASERTNRARHNRSFRQRLRSDESYTSDPSLPPRLPLHKSRLRREKPSEETSGARHCRTNGFPSADRSSLGFESSVEPYSSLENSSSSSSLSNDLIPQVDDYILPSEGPKAPPDTKEEVSMIPQEQVKQVERITRIRERGIQSDPTTRQNETSETRKSTTRQRAASQPNPYSHYQRMAEFFVPILYRVLSKYQRKCLEFHQETEKAIVPRWPAPQEYMLRELVKAAVFLMQPGNREEVKRLSKESRRKHRPRRRRKRSSVLDELCDQLSFLDQKLLEITSETIANENKVIEDEDPFVDDEGSPFIEQIDDWSDDEIPFEVEGIQDETTRQEIFDFPAEVGGSLEEANHQDLFAGLDSNDPEFKDLIEMAYVVTDLSRDQFIDAHQRESMEEDEDDNMEQELTNLSFVEEIIQTELSQVDSGEGTYKDELVGGDIILGQLSQEVSGEGTIQDESFGEETVTTAEVLQASLDMGTLQDHSAVVEIIETKISQLDSEEGTFRQVSVTTERFDSEVSDDGLVEDIYEEEPFDEKIVLADVSQVVSINRGEESMVEEKITEAMTCSNRLVQESVADVKDKVNLEPQETNDATQVKVSRVVLINGGEESVAEEEITESITCDNRLVQETVADAKDNATQVRVEKGSSNVPEKMRFRVVKELRWEDDMPDDELQEDANMFPDDEMNMTEQTVVEMHAYVAENATVPSIKTSSLEEKREEDLGSSEHRERISSDLQSVPSDEKEVSFAKLPYSETGPKHVAPATRKERLSFQSTTTVRAEGTDDQFASKPSVLSRFKNPSVLSRFKNRNVADISRANKAETVSHDVNYVPRKREVASLQPSKISPSARDVNYIPRKREVVSLQRSKMSTSARDVTHIPRKREVVSLQPSKVSSIAKIHDDVTVNSTPSDEASEGIKETRSKDGSEIGTERKPEMNENSNRDALTTSVVEESIDEKNPAVEIIVATASRKFDSKQTVQPLESAPSWETEESDPICAAVNRKLAEVRQSSIADPDDELIMETIGMSMSINSDSQTPRSTASDAIPDPDDSMIIENLSPCLDGIKLKIEKAELDDGEGSFPRKCGIEVESGADDEVVMETVYLAESEMVTEKLFTLTEEATTSSSCNASVQGSTGNDRHCKREGHQNSTNGKVRDAIMKFSGGGSSSCFSPKEADVPLDAKSGVQKKQAQSQKDKSSAESKDAQRSRQQLQPNGNYTKGSAAALIARFEAKGGPANTVKTPLVVLKEEPHVDGDFDIKTNAAPLTTTQSSSDVHGGSREAATTTLELSGRTAMGFPPTLIAELKIKLNSPLAKPSSEPGLKAFYDKIPNLLSAASEPQFEASNGKRKVSGSPSKMGSALQIVTSANVPNSSSKRELKKNSKVNKLRSQFESKMSMKKSPSEDKEESREARGDFTAAVRNDPKIEEKIESKTPSRKQLPLHGFVNTAFEKDGSKPESLMDKVKPPVHTPSKNFSQGPIDFEALNESLLQIDREEQTERKDGMHGHKNDKATKSVDDEATIPPITELQLKEVTSLVSELEGPREKMFPRGMCHCLMAGGGKSSDDNNSIEQLKKVGRREKNHKPTQKDNSNHDELVPPVFSMDALLDENMQRTADAAVKALEQVLAQGAANAAAAITQNDSQVSCLQDCISPVTEGSLNAFSQAITHKSAKKTTIPKGDDETLTLDDNKAKAHEAAKIDEKADSMPEGPNQSSHRKEPSKGLLVLTNINENDENDDWARIAIEENNVDDLIEALRSKSSDSEPLMNVSLVPSTPMANQGYLSRVDATASPISSDWAGSIGRLGVQPLSAAQRDEWSKRNLLSGTTTLSSGLEPLSPNFNPPSGTTTLSSGIQPLSAAQRDEWSKRNLLSGTTTLSSEEGSGCYLQQHRHQCSQGEDFDERQVDRDFHYESPTGSIRRPYDGMLKEQKKNGGPPPKTTRSQNRFKDPPSGRLHPQDEKVVSKGNREAHPFETDCLNYTNKDRNGNATLKQKDQRPDYFDFPAPPSQEMSELTMSQGETTHTMKSQDPEKALESFKEVENRGASSSNWLYDSRRGTSPTMPTSSRSARTTTTRAAAEKRTIPVENKRDSSSSMWCSESFGMMIQDCFATSPSHQQEIIATKAITDAPKSLVTPKRSPPKRSRPPPTSRLV